MLRVKWTLERLIGVGGMAAVYAARHAIGRLDAIKILHPDVARSESVRERFLLEAKAVNQFKHPGAVEVRDFDFAEDGSPFLVMELLEGESLAARARRLGALPLDELLSWAEQLLDVLAAAHESGIIHRDIKPENLFICQDGRLKVLDFGIARLTGDALGAPLTRRGLAIGTLPYMAPEQVRGLDIDKRADVFSVGATLFRLIARRRIHEAANDAEMVGKMADEHAPPLATVVPEAPAGLCLIVDRALEYDRELRYPDARTMQSDVRALLRGDDLPEASRIRLAPRDGPVTLTDERTAGPLAMPPAVTLPQVMLAAPIGGAASDNTDITAHVASTPAAEHSVHPALVVVLTLLGVVLFALVSCFGLSGVAVLQRGSSRSVSAQVSCDPTSDVDRIVCRAAQRSGKRAANACWDMRIDCSDGNRVVGRVCQAVPSKGTVSRDVLVSRLSPGASCGAVRSIVVDRVQAEAVDGGG